MEQLSIDGISKITSGMVDYFGKKRKVARIQHQKADESVEDFYEKWKSIGITLKEHKVYHLIDSQAEARDFLCKLNRVRFRKLQ